MSHLTTYNSEVLVNTKKSLLGKAIADLGLEINHDIKVIKNTWITENVDAGLLKDGKPISIGFKYIKEGSKTKLEVAGDFFGTGINEKEFIDKLSQSYKKHDVVRQCKEQGWNVNKRDIEIDSKTGEIIITASRHVV